MTYSDFIKLVEQTNNQFNWRYGQSLMNVLHGVCSEKHKQIVNTDNDCYYDDNKVNVVLELLKIDWDSNK